MRRHPSVLHASTTLAGTSGEQKALRNHALRVPAGYAFDIYRMAFSIKPSVGTLVSGGSVSANMTVGDIPITNGYVPIWSFCQQVAQESEDAGFFGWNLSRALTCYSSTSINAMFAHTGMTRSDLTVRMILFGEMRPSSAKPHMSELPWIAGYSGEIVDFNNANSESSTEFDLIAPDNSPLVLERIVGRINTYRQVDDTNVEYAGDHLYTARMKHSSGQALTTKYVGFRQLFGYEGKSWAQRQTRMDPDSYYIVELNKAASSVGPANYRLQPFVGLVGWRQV